MLQKDTCTETLVGTYKHLYVAFSAMFAGKNRKIGKHLTKEIEGVNNSLRARNRRFVRKTTCFSKKIQNHDAQIAIMLQQRNYDYHTF